SERSRSGRPNSRKAASSTGHTCTASLFASTWQRSRYRLCASDSVRGSQRVPSPVRNQPLKSIAHTSLAPAQAANGAVAGGGRRLRRGVTAQPLRANEGAGGRG